MKTLLITLVLMVSSSLYAPTFENKIKEEAKIEKKVVKIVEEKTHDDFLDALGFKESSNRYGVVNRFGYMGKYQFGMATLKNLGWNISRKEFLSNPHLQEEAMQDLLEHNYNNLKYYINKFEGKTINGIYITESGILAAAHLGGAGSVRTFFKKGYDFQDGNGTKITTYMSLFKGYNLNIYNKNNG